MATDHWRGRVYRTAYAQAVLHFGHRGQHSPGASEDDPTARVAAWIAGNLGVDFANEDVARVMRDASEGKPAGG